MARPDPAGPPHAGPPPTSAAGPVSARGSLSRELVLTHAVDYIDRHGLRALTMRRLAAELGVEAMALYRYVPSREQLLDAVVETVVDELTADMADDLELAADPVPCAPCADADPPAADPCRHGARVDGPSAQSWQEFLRRLAHGVRRIALTHPEVFPLVATRPTAAPWIRPPLRSLRWVEAFFAALISRGFSDDAAVAAYRAFTGFLLGHLLLEVSTSGVDIGPVDEPDPPLDASAAARSASSVAGLQDHPHLVRLSPLLAEDHSAEEFTTALNHLLTRLEHLNPQPTAPVEQR